ncbi:hypothetical protein JCM6882_000125 [Rhodosporidiobolus microsporus]
MAPLNSRTNSWDRDDEATPVVSPTASAAVSRSPTLVDLPSLGLDAALAGGSFEAEKTAKKDFEQDEEAEKANDLKKQEQHQHHFHLPHPHLPHPPPHQHLEQFYPPENYDTTDQIAREKEEARRMAAGEAAQGSDAEKGGERYEEDAAVKAAQGQADDYPDGGMQAWLVVAGAWAVSFTSWGYPNSFGVILTYTKQHQLADYPTSSIAWIGAFQLSANLFCGLLSGKAFDAGYVRHLLVAGLLFYTAGLFGLSYAKTYWQIFLAQGLACGIASGLMFLPACSAVSHWFKKKRMLALGVLATGSSMGGVLYPSLINKLLHSSLGFGWTFRVVGFINLALLLFACFTIKSRLPPRPAGRIVDFSVFKGDPGFTLYVLGAAIVWLGLYVPLFYSEEVALAHGVREDIAFYSLSILNGVSAFGRTVPNFFADRYGVLNLLFPFTAISGILCFCWIAAMKTDAGVVVWSVLYGFFQGAFVSMLPASVAALTDNMNEIGIRLAMAFLCQSVTALVGPPIAGYAIALHPGQGGFTGAGIYSGATVILGVFFIGLARMIVSKRRNTPWV